MMDRSMTEVSNFETRMFAGIPIAKASLGQACDLLLESGLQRKKLAVHLVNTYTLSLTRHDQALGRCLSDADLNLPDGKPLSVLTRFSKAQLRQVRGPDLFSRTLAKAQFGGTRHYFLGGDEATLRRLVDHCMHSYPGLEIAGYCSPPFRPLSDDEISLQDSDIVNSGAHIVWVGLGTPKQDFELERLARSIGVVAVGVGAAFNFESGQIATAPKWLRNLGLEWLHRLFQEPRRLMRRYSVGAIDFLFVYVRKELLRMK
jgi:N-acetylglucosaminyldiphosphoundecaprenol N-acetyl-beta-D-mannosaminyltransferase